MAAGAILHFIEPKIAPFDPPTPITPSRTKYGVDWMHRLWDIFAFKLYCDLETGVQGHPRSSKAALFDTAHTTSYSSYSKYASICYRFHIGRKSLPSCIRCHRCGWSRQIYATTLADQKTRTMGLSDSERISMIHSAFCYKARVWQTDGRTDRRNCRCIYALCCRACKPNTFEPGLRLQMSAHLYSELIFERRWQTATAYELADARA